jgi:Rod binding domain-containing protein
MTPPLSLTRTPQMTGATKRAPAAERHDKLVHQTQRLVSQTFYGTMLKQMHESPFKSDKFDGGRGGQAFSSLLDQHLADRMSRGAGGKLVTTIVRHIEHATSKAAAQSGAAIQQGKAINASRNATYSASALRAGRMAGPATAVGK